MNRSRFLFLALVCCVSSATFGQVVPMTNEECTTAIPIFTGINPGAPTGLSGNVFTNAGSAAALSAGSPGMCGSGANSDVWFSYTALATGSHTFQTCTPAGFTTGTHIDTILQVLDGAACPPTVALGCDDDTCTNVPSFNSSIVVTLTATQTYYVRIATWSGEADGTFYITVLAPTPPPPAPSNNECASPIAISEGENGPYTNAGATASAGFTTPCGVVGSTTGFSDVFFNWTATADCDGDVTIETCDPAGFTGTNQDTQITVWSPSDCPTPAGPPIACNDDAGCGATGFQSSVTFPYVVGTTYLVRVSGWSAVDVGTFKITVTRSGTASSAQLGPGCSDGGGAGPLLDIDAPPVLGSTRTLTITGGAPNSPGILFFSPPGASSPLPGGCTLYVANAQLTIFLFVLTDGTGSWSFTGTVPSDPVFECEHLYLQAFLLPPTLVPFYQVTSGLDVALGY